MIKWTKVKLPHEEYQDGYRSADGRFTIVKTDQTASRNGYWKRAWHLLDGDKRVLSLADRMSDCKHEAEYIVMQGGGK